jgi:hypothetical protein
MAPTTPCSSAFPPLTEEALTAYHEAGHALAFSLIGRELVQVFLGPEPGNGGCELTPIETPFDLSDPRMQALAAQHLVAHLAGPVAEAILLGREEDCVGLTFSASDLREARLIAEKLVRVRTAGEAEQASAVLFWRTWSATAAWLHCAAQWAAVEVLARALVVQRCVKGPHARRLIAVALEGRVEKLPQQCLFIPG